MYHVAIVGATGAVGTEMLKVLDQRHFPASSMRLFASPRSLGKSLQFRGQDIPLEVVQSDSFAGVDLALFSAGSDSTKAYRDQANAAGAVIIDNSSAFRMDPSVPLVIPEINAEDCDWHQGLLAVPNCSTIVMLMAVAPLRSLGKIRRIVVSTYQAVSGAGYKAIEELLDQTRRVLNGEAVRPDVLPHQIAFNLLCHNSAVNEHGYNGEEWKMIHETKKILHDEEIKVTATCVRVPVLRSHSESINIEFESGRPNVEQVRACLAAFPGVRVVDDRDANHFPMPIETSEQDDVFVGHIREDVSNPNAIELFASGDQLLKGAALGAVQIAEVLHKRGLLRTSEKGTAA